MLRLRAPWVEAAGGGSASRRANFRPQHSHFVFAFRAFLARPRSSSSGAPSGARDFGKKFGLLLTQKRHLK